MITMTLNNILKKIAEIGAVAQHCQNDPDSQELFLLPIRLSLQNDRLRRLLIANSLGDTVDDLTEEEEIEHMDDWFETYIGNGGKR